MMMLLLLHEKISTWNLSLCVYPHWLGFDVHGHDVLVLIMKYIFVRKVAGVFSRKGFPRVKYGVHCACLFYVM